MINDTENKIEILRLQDCSLKNRSFWKLVISLWNEDSNFWIVYMKDLIFLENNIVSFWNSWMSTDSSMELYNLFSYSGFFF